MYPNTPAGYSAALADAGGDPRRLWIDSGLIYVLPTAPTEPGSESYGAIATGLLPFDRFVTPEKFGAVAGNDQAPAVQAAINSGYPVLLTRDYSCTSLTVPTTTQFFGPGRLIARTAQGTKPTISAFEAAGSSAARLALLQAYCPNAITLTGGQSSRMDLRAKGFLIRGDAINWTIFGRVELEACAIYKASITLVNSGSLVAPGLVSSDSINDAVLCSFGGRADLTGALIYKPALNGLYVFGGGSIKASGGAYVWRAGRRGVECNQGGSIDISGGNIQFSKNPNISITYTGSISLGAGVASNSIESCGIAAESGGNVYAEGATISGNALWGCTVSYSGFIQARGSTISGNGKEAAITLTGGQINVTAAAIPATNNAGGVQLLARQNGVIFSEPAGGEGKTALSAEHYSPLHGVIGSTGGLITPDVGGSA